jgi:hypothetical protein
VPCAAVPVAGVIGFSQYLRTVLFYFGLSSAAAFRN